MVSLYTTPKDSRRLPRSTTPPGMRREQMRGGKKKTAKFSTPACRQTRGGRFALLHFTLMWCLLMFIHTQGCNTRRRECILYQSITYTTAVVACCFPSDETAVSTIYTLVKYNTCMIQLLVIVSPSTLRQRVLWTLATRI